MTSRDDVAHATRLLLDALRRTPALRKDFDESVRKLGADVMAVHSGPEAPFVVFIEVKASPPASEGLASVWEAGSAGATRAEEVSQVALFVSRLADAADVPEGEALEVLSLVARSALAERRLATRFRRELTTWLTPSLAELDPVPRAAIDQARRLASLRTELLATGAFTYEALAEGRGASPAAVRQFVRRSKERRELFTVAHDGETLVPAFLLDAALAPRPVLKPAIEALRDAGEDGWGLWAWFASPSGWLGGRRPVDVADEDPDAVAEAAQRRASNAA